MTALTDQLRRWCNPQLTSPLATCQKTTGYQQQRFSSAWQEKVHPSLLYDHWFRRIMGLEPAPGLFGPRRGYILGDRKTVVPNLPTQMCFPWRTSELLRNTGRTCKLQTERPRAWGIDPATLWLWGHSTNYHCIPTLIKTQQSSGFQFLLSQKKTIN